MTAPPRASVTFILGSDSDLDNPYFQHAAQYYRQEANSQDMIVTNLRSLTEVYDFLCSQEPPHSRPWAAIRLVVHSNPWMGMSVAASPGEQRTTTAQLDRLAAANLLGELPPEVADLHTQLQLWGCSLGENQTLLRRMGEIFGVRQVLSPRAFVQYQRDRNGRMTRALNRVYFTTYPTGYHPGNAALARRLAQTYPDNQLDWRKALAANGRAIAGTTYSYTFKVPISWIVTYPTSQSRPPVGTSEDQKAWLRAQGDLLARINTLGMTQDAFTWTIYPTQYTFPDGSREPAIKAIGLCSIVCVLDPVPEPEGGRGIGYRPLRPSLMDGTYFACVDLP